MIDDSLPTTTRHKLESVQTFDGMVREVREMELEKVGQTSLSVERKCGQVHQVTAQPGPDSQSSGLTKLTQAVQQLCTRLETIEKAKPADVLQSDVLTKILNRLEQLETPSSGGATSVPEERQRQQWSTKRGKSSKDIVCYRCQKSGHVSRDCLAPKPSRVSKD